MISNSSPAIIPGEAGSPKEKVFTVGSLIYTRAGLLSLFGWLLWGDFILTLMESVMPSLTPLLLKTHGASNREIVFIGSTIFMILNSALNPIISYQSDRLRSRWGRRRPFIVVTTPFVVLFLAAIPFAPEILSGIRSVGILDRLLSISPLAPLILMFIFLVAGFQAFNMFISSVYYYLIPDVVPKEFLGRFYSLFRVFGAAAGMGYNYFIFGTAETHMRSIFVLTSLVYGFAILLMCWRVKEGEYPPAIVEAHGRWWSGIHNYAKECFGYSYYWWVFLAYSALGWGSAGNVVTVFFYRDDLGFSLDFIGKMTAWSGFLFLVLSYPMGMLIDRWGSHKTIILGTALVPIFSILTFFLAVDKESAIVWMMLRSLPLALSGMAAMKWTVDVYPHDRYGQFGSAGALFSSIGGIVAASVFGWWIDWVKAYRYLFLWNAFFSVMGLVALLIVYRRWKVLGGPENYHAP